MKNIVSPNTRTLLVHSRRAVERSEATIRDAMSKALARSDRDPELSDTPETVATLLLRFLIEQAVQITGTGTTGNLGLYRTEQRLNGIDGRHYSRFGDALVPVLMDILGPTYPRATASAWSDAYWAIVHRMRTDGANSVQSAAPAAEAVA